MVRDYSEATFLGSLEPSVPELSRRDLLPRPAGVDAQALSADGQLVDDCVANVQDGRIVYIRNAPSPTAVASLTIARLIADTTDEGLHLAVGQWARRLAAE
jgi:L-2-hydroxyglutarate oxidase